MEVCLSSTSSSWSRSRPCIDRSAERLCGEMKTLCLHCRVVKLHRAPEVSLLIYHPAAGHGALSPFPPTWIWGRAASAAKRFFNCFKPIRKSKAGGEMNGLCAASRAKQQKQNPPARADSPRAKSPPTGSLFISPVRTGETGGELREQVFYFDTAGSQDAGHSLSSETPGTESTKFKRRTNKSTNEDSTINKATVLLFSTLCSGAPPNDSSL